MCNHRRQSSIETEVPPSRWVLRVAVVLAGLLNATSYAAEPTSAPRRSLCCNSPMEGSRSVS